MCNVKGSAALVIAAAAMIMFLTGCETTKHAEVMSAEELATQAQASVSEGSGTGSGGKQGGIPLTDQGMSEGSLSGGDSLDTVAATGSSELSPASINSKDLPSPTLSDASMGGDISGGQFLSQGMWVIVGIRRKSHSFVDNFVVLINKYMNNVYTGLYTGSLFFLYGGRAGSPFQFWMG